MDDFARTAQRIAQTAATGEKTQLLAAYLRGLESDDDLAAAVRFFTGNPFAASDRRTLSIGGATIARVAQRLWGFDDSAFRAAYRDAGDLGSALARLVRPPQHASLFARPALEPAALSEAFAAIASASGKNSAKRRETLLEDVFRATSDPASIAFVVKIVTGDLRIGLREGLVLNAIAAAFGADPPAVRRAFMAAGDAGAVAAAARHQTLAEIHVAYGNPIGFMLASPMPFGDTYAPLTGARWAVEDKYDGIRAQAHVDGDRIALFSRTLNDVAATYPEVVAALRELPRRAIFDGEIVAMRDGNVLPFRALQARISRKDVADELREDVPVAYVAFDLLADGDELLLDEPYERRRERLASILESLTSVKVAPCEMLDAADAPLVNPAFEAARARGNEGLMLKRADSPYAPGRRGKWWIKLKRELSTLDVVVVAVEWGHGKRSKVLSDYTFAVRGDDGQLVAIGKAYSGLTDAEIAELTPWFLEHRLPRESQRAKARSGEIPVEPEVVIEVAFDIIQVSDLHESGFSLRFPRIVRIRDDKPSYEIDTLGRVREVYQEQLQRERL
ncbi:MAG TPA: ATP-dependent DNA ligase [Candidatus Tumulicola sp.]